MRTVSTNIRKFCSVLRSNFWTLRNVNIQCHDTWFLIYKFQSSNIYNKVASSLHMSSPLHKDPANQRMRPPVFNLYRSMTHQRNHYCLYVNVEDGSQHTQGRGPPAHLEEATREGTLGRGVRAKYPTIRLSLPSHDVKNGLDLLSLVRQ